MKVNKKVFFVLVMLIILANGYQSYNSYNERRIIAYQKKEIEKKSQELKVADRTILLALDSLKRRKVELAAMGEDTVELGIKIREIEKERGRYINESEFNRTRYNQILKEIKVISLGVDKITRTKELESKSLKDELRALKIDLETQRLINRNAKDSIRILLHENTKLSSSISAISAITSTPIKFLVIGNSGKSKEKNHIKASCKGVRFEFFLNENKHVTSGFKSVFICIRPPGTASEPTIVTHQKIWFTGEKMKVSFDFLNKGSFVPGEYNVELRIDNAKICQGTFNIN